VSASGGQKPQFLANFDFWGLLYRPPFTDQGQIWCAIADPQYTLTCQISSQSIYSVALCWRKTPFLAVFGLRHLVLSPIGNSLTKCTVHNYKPSPIQRHQNRFCTPTPSWRNRAHNIWRSKAWRTDRQTKKLNFFGHPGGGWNPSPNKLGTVIDDLEQVLAPHKRSGVWRIVSPLEGAENLVITRPHQLKTPITP